MELARGRQKALAEFREAVRHRGELLRQLSAIVPHQKPPGWLKLRGARDAGL